MIVRAITTKIKNREKYPNRKTDSHKNANSQTKENKTIRN